jgi:deoxyguanosine kinase
MTSEHPPAVPPVTSPPAENPAPAHRFIVLEGPIGVGKTTLAGKLAETLGAELVLERADSNPFLERFYRNPRAGALAA